MSPTGARDRLQPSLLDRLLDNSPGKDVEPPEERVLSRQQLRAAVLRDLTWLFNAVSAESDPPPDTRHGHSNRALAKDWAAAPEVRRSVLNYGVPSMTGMSMSQTDATAIQRDLIAAIRAYEPRIEAESLDVRVNIRRADHHNAMQIEIRGRLWSRPVPLELLLAAEVDVETGSAQLRDLRA